jgi:type I restriction enzyme S subunit
LKTVPLGRVSEINPRKPRDLSPEVECSFVPMEYVDDRLGAIANTTTRRVEEVQKGYTYFGDRDVLFAKITPCMENGKCAIATNLVNDIGFGSTEFHVVRPKHDVIPEWVFYFLRQQSTRDEAARHMTGTAGQQRVPTRFLAEVEIPLPPLPEQQRIAAVLARADRLRRLRRYALDLGDGYLQSVFLQMFGDPVTNPMGWRSATIRSLCDRIIDYRGRTPPYSDNGIPHITASCIKNSQIDWSQCKYVSKETYTNYMTRGLPEFGDVIFTTEAPMGETAIVDTHEEFSLAQRLLLLRTDQSRMVPQYLSTLLSHPSFFPKLKQYVTGSTVLGIRSVHLVSITIPIPNLVLQRKLTRIVYQFEHLRSQQREAQRQAEHLFQALLHRAFQGEL